MKRKEVKRREVNRNEKNGQTLFFPKIAFFFNIKKINTSIFWCMVILHGPHSVYT